MTTFKNDYFLIIQEGIPEAAVSLQTDRFLVGEGRRQVLFAGFGGVQQFQFLVKFSHQTTAEVGVAVFGVGLSVEEVVFQREVVSFAQVAGDELFDGCQELFVAQDVEVAVDDTA